MSAAEPLNLEALEALLRFIIAQDPIALLESSSRPAIDAKMFLRALACAPFVPSDLLSIQGTNRATVYRRVKSWNSARILSSPGFTPKRLSWDRQVKSQQERLLRRAVDGSRRGRPARMFWIIDPIRPRLPTPAECRDLAALFRKPLVREFHATMAERVVKIMATARGRKVFGEWLVAAAPSDLRGPLLEAAQVMASAQPALVGRLLAETRTHMDWSTAFFMPRLASMFEEAANRGLGRK